MKIERSKAMKTWLAVLLSTGIVLLFGLPTVASAGSKSSFALFDGTNPANQPDSGAVCSANEVKKGKDVKKDKAFTYHVAVTNHGGAGFVRITYFDGDFVQYKIPVDGSFSFSQAAGSKGGADRAVRVSNGGSAAVLVGSMSAIGDEEKPSCTSCDADDAGDAGCDDIVPN